MVGEGYLDWVSCNVDKTGYIINICGVLLNL